MSVVEALIFIVVLSLVGYRVAMFIMLDVIFERPRDAVHDFLQRGPKRIWILQMITCVLCLSVWLSAGLVGATLLFTDVPLPVWVWLGTATGIVWIWRTIDPEGENTVTIEVKDK
jgi:hypothetical protein